LYLLYKFNDYGRQLFIVTNILAILFVFSDGYVVFDSFDYFLDSIATALVGFTIAISYFSNLSKEFKKKK
jgi:SNF family Na+-dependent transporter